MRARHILIYSLIGILIGFITVDVYSLGPWDILVWGLVGIAAGYFIPSRTKQELAVAGLLYGFFMSMAFLLFGFHGTPDKLFGFILFSIGLSFAAALGGWLAVFIGSKLRRGKT